MEPVFSSVFSSSLKDKEEVNVSFCIRAESNFMPVKEVVPFIVCQLLLQQEHLSFEFILLLQDVPQLLQGEARLVRVLLWVFIRRSILHSKQIFILSTAQLKNKYYKMKEVGYAVEVKLVFSSNVQQKKEQTKFQP